ncbi:MAG: nickel-responsive transcriptional regulator NikR [Verrucomicrobiae bacterium]|nr:nickel-responsive transcriptional regulator NikR [Verrucomicrobiae bacterium]
MHTHPHAPREPLSRISITMPRSLLRKMDALAESCGQKNRSQALAGMVRALLVEHESEAGQGEAVGTITLVYDHHRSRLQETLTHIQHEHGREIISGLHVHLDHNNCLEVLVVRGGAARLRRLADRLATVRGVKHGKLTLTTSGRNLPV